MKLWVLGIDPGLSGAFVLTNGEDVRVWLMPVKHYGKEREIDFKGVTNILGKTRTGATIPHIYLERAVAFGMGTKSAFNYGRGFAALEIAINLSRIPATHIEPGKWTKVMHAGIDARLKPKEKSQIAVSRVAPHLVSALPKRGERFAEGPMDALLIALYGLRELNGANKMQIEDFR